MQQRAFHILLARFLYMPGMPVERFSLHTLPPELLNAVVDAIPERRDLLSLALVCSTLRDIIIPGHIQYRVVVASEAEVGLWACLAVRGHLARNVRSLEIFAFFMLTGIFSTMLIPETKHQSLEVPSNESQDEFIQGARHFPPPLCLDTP